MNIFSFYYFCSNLKKTQDVLALGKKDKKPAAKKHPIFINDVAAKGLNLIVVVLISVLLLSGVGRSYILQVKFDRLRLYCISEMRKHRHVSVCDAGLLG